MTSAGRGRTTALSALAIPVVVGLALTGCSGSGDGNGGDASSIRVADYYTDEPARSIIGGMLDDCGEAAGVTIEREAVPSGEYLSRVLQQSSSRTLPDIQMFDAQDLPVIAQSGALAPVSERGVSLDNIGESVRTLGEYDGELYGGAPTVGAVVLFYDAELFAAEGVEVPTTWEELAETAAALTTSDRYGIAFSAKNDGQGTYVFLPFMWSNGGLEDDLDSPAVQEALQFEVDLVTSGSASQSVVQWGNSDVGDQFLAGSAAMAITSGAQMSKFDEQGGIDYGVAEIPAPAADDTTIGALGGEVWTLPRSGDDAREAKAAEVLECILSDDVQSSLAIERRSVPANPELDEAYLAELPDLGAYVELVRNGRSRTELLGAGWPDANAAIWTAVQSAVTGQQTVEAALADAAASVG